MTPADLPNLFDANGNPLYDTDWQDEAIKRLSTIITKSASGAEPIRPCIACIWDICIRMP